ncbi:MAG: prohibitin family protein [Bacteroidetes bacterium]|nr:prohibitin family protein [Bacteroidota bacterium]
MNQNLIRLGVIGIIALVVIVYFSRSIFVTIDPGQNGVIFRRFSGGLDKEKVFAQGFHVIAPWNKMYVYNVRIQTEVSGMDVLSTNGLTIKVELSYRYQPDVANLGLLHDTIGQGYHESIIIPEIRSATRQVIGKYLPEELYSRKREVIQDEIFKATAVNLAEKYIILDAVLIREVTLPPSLQQAIEKKLKQEQESLEYEFKLTREAKEAERKIIEAEGKAAFNRILSASLTDKILQEKGIEATLKLAESPNTKTIIIGAGDGGLPIILGGN